MSAQLLSSKIVVQEEPPSLRTIAGGPTGVAAVVGITAMGPVAQATLLTSYEQFQRIFGGDISAGYAASAVRGFFQNGGERMYFTRVVHYKKSGNTWTKLSAAGSLDLLSANGVPTAAQVTGTVQGPFQLTPGLTLILSRDAVAGQATATFNATSAQIEGGAGPFNLSPNQTLQIRVDGSSVQTVTFTAADFVNIAAATLTEVIAAINDTLTGAQAVVSEATLAVRANSAGTASSIEIAGGTALTPLGFSASTASGTGNVADIDAVTVAEVKTVLEAAVSGVTVANSNGRVRIAAATTGPTGTLTVQPTSTGADELGLPTTAVFGSTGVAAPTLRVNAKYDGEYSTIITVLVAPATSGIGTEFNLSVLIGGTVVEIFPNLTMLDTASNYAPTVINAAAGSQYIAVEDLQLSPGVSGVASERPAYSSGTPRVPFGPLTGGANGLAGNDNGTPYSVAESDFIGEEGNRIGFHSFDLVDDVELLLCPEIASPAIHTAALSYVSVYRNGTMFFIADPPAGLSPDGVNDYVLNQAQLKNTTEHAAFYWPRVRVLNPSTAIYGNVASIVVPPCGHIAGMYARTDGSQIGGVYQPPGGVERGQLFGVVGFENDQVLDERVRDILAPNCINPITRVRGWPIAVDDVLTLAPGGNFPTIAERRGVTYIENAIRDGLQFCRLRNNDENLRRAVKRTVEAFLLIQMRAGAFRTVNPQTAFFVDVSEAINPPSEVFAGRVNVRVGLATQKPARFLILSFAQDTRALDEELAAAG